MRDAMVGNACFEVTVVFVLVARSSNYFVDTAFICFGEVSEVGSKVRRTLEGLNELRSDVVREVVIVSAIFVGLDEELGVGKVIEHGFHHLWVDGFEIDVGKVAELSGVFRHRVEGSAFGGPVRDVLEGEGNGLTAFVDVGEDVDAS